MATPTSPSDSIGTLSNQVVTSVELEQIFKDMIVGLEEAYHSGKNYYDFAGVKADLMRWHERNSEREKLEADPLYQKYLQAKQMQKDERSMSYIAKRLGYKYPSGVKYLLDRFDKGIDLGLDNPESKEKA